MQRRPVVLGATAGWHHGAVTLGELFTPVPLRWGLWGDPHLWEAMRQRFADTRSPLTNGPS